MPFGKVLPAPGINAEYSPTLNRAGWSASNLMRWRQGLPEKLGGWSVFCPTPVVGTGLGMFSWADNLGNTYLMVGTEQRLEVITGGALYDITPLRATSNNVVNFSTVIHTPVVTIIDNASDTAAGDWVYIVVPVSVGGLIIQGFYQVVTAIDANTYTINAGSNATTTVNNGGAVPSFTTINTQAAVNVLLNNHGLSTGQSFQVEVSTTGGGVTLVGYYIITKVDANNFTITASTVATSGATFSENGGNARIEYLIPTRLAVNTALSGYGIGDYGAGDYGLSGTSTAISKLSRWSADAWGQDLVCCYSQGPIYVWVPPIAGTFPGNIATNPATVISQAPSIVANVFVHSQAEILVAAGCNPPSGGAFDPLLVAWCTQDDFTVWTPSSANQAGSYRLKSGSKIVNALFVHQTALIWTDVDLWVMQYIGYPDVFGFQVVGQNCGLIAEAAVDHLNSAIYWMGRDNFYVTSGGAAPYPLKCDVWDFVFQNLNQQQLDQIVCAVNPLFNEVSWFFPTSGSLINNAYVKYKTDEQIWDYGMLTRTAWDQGLIIGGPVGCDQNSLVQQHETSPDANGAPLSYSFTTGYFDIAEGEEFPYIDQIWPDFVETSGAMVQVIVNVVDYPGQTPRVYGPYTVTQGTKQMISLNARGRQISLTFSGNDLGSFVRLGAVRYRFGTSGRRGVS